MKLTLDMKKTFHIALREAVDYRDRWHLPAKIWLMKEAAGFWFEAQPDTVRLGGDSEILIELDGNQLNSLADAVGTDQWDIEVNWLLDKALADA